MRASLTLEHRPAVIRWLLLVLLCWSAAAVADDEFTVRSAETALVDSVYVLDAQIDYAFSPEALEALRNGIPLTLSIDIQVQRQRNWWLDETIANLEQRYRLYYHALSDQFLVRNLNSSAQYSFNSLKAAIHTMGTVHHLPILDKKLVRADQRYTVSLRARLDIEELPSPLRPFAYLSPAWRLSSSWYSCSLAP